MIRLFDVVLEQINLNKFITLLSIMIFSSVSFATDKCETEQKSVKYWNDSLQNEATEYKREKHRAAKQEFLLCLRKPERDIKQPREKRDKKANTQNFRAKRIKKSSHSSIQMTHYTGFIGEKLVAWNKYFIELDECLENKGDMTLFVKCGEDRKRHIEIFETRWDNTNKRLSISIE